MSKKESITTKSALRKRAQSTTLRKVRAHAEAVNRARAIITDADGYDRDTRRFIHNSLAQSSFDQLAEDVRRAEAGEEFLDIGNDLDADPQAALTLPELLSEVMNHPDLPDDLTEGFGEALIAMFNGLDRRPQRFVEHNPTYISRLLAKHKTDRREFADDEKGGEG